MKKSLLLGTIVLICLMLFTGCKKDYGKNKSGDSKFYTLQEAYDEGFLTKEDLEAIKPQNNNLSKEVKDKIRNSFRVFFNCREDDEIIINRYYGTFNGAVVLMIESSDWGYLQVVWEEEIAGVVFSYPDSQRIWVWKE